MSVQQMSNRELISGIRKMINNRIVAAEIAEDAESINRAIVENNCEYDPEYQEIVNSFNFK